MHSTDPIGVADPAGAGSRLVSGSVAGRARVLVDGLTWTGFTQPAAAAPAAAAPPASPSTVAPAVGTDRCIPGRPRPAGQLGGRTSGGAVDDITGGGTAILGYFGALGLSLLFQQVASALGVRELTAPSVVFGMLGLWTGLWMTAYIVSHRRPGGSHQGPRAPCSPRRSEIGLGIAVGFIGLVIATPGRRGPARTSSPTTAAVASLRHSQPEHGARLRGRRPRVRRRADRRGALLPRRRAARLMRNLGSTPGIVVAGDALRPPRTSSSA